MFHNQSDYRSAKWHTVACPVHPILKGKHYAVKCPTKCHAKPKGRQNNSWSCLIFVHNIYLFFKIQFKNTIYGLWKFLPQDVAILLQCLFTYTSLYNFGFISSNAQLRKYSSSCFRQQSWRYFMQNKLHICVPS